MLRIDGRVKATPCARRSPATPAHVTTLVVAVLVDALVVTGAVLLGLGLPWVLGVGALTVATVALATQRSLRSALAGLVLLLARPYAPGERLRLWSPRARRLVDAEVVRIGLVNTTLADPDGVLVVPNTLLLRRPPECRDR